MIYDELRRRQWSERANNNDASLNIEAEAAEIDKGILMQAESRYDAIEVSNGCAWSLCCRLSPIVAQGRESCQQDFSQGSERQRRRKGKSGGKGKGGDKSGSSAWHQSTNGGQKRQQFNKNFAKNWKRQRY